MITVVAIWRYPVKSMRGETLARTRIDGRIPGDREWGVFDAATGKLLSAKSVGTLLAARARRDGEHTAIELPDGTTVIAGSERADRVVGDWLGWPIAIRRADAGPATIELEIDEGDEAGPSGTKTIETQPGSLFDSRSTLHLVGAASLEALDRDHAAGAGDVRRFRPNLVVDGLAAFAEDDWVGRDVTIGSVPAHVRKRTERCVMTSRGQPGVAADRGLLRHLIAQRDFRFGIYLDPRAAGELAVGDGVVAIGNDQDG